MEKIRKVVNNLLEAQAGILPSDAILIHDTKQFVLNLIKEYHLNKDIEGLVISMIYAILRYASRIDNMEQLEKFYDDFEKLFDKHNANLYKE